MVPRDTDCHHVMSQKISSLPPGILFCSPALPGMECDRIPHGISYYSDSPMLGSEKPHAALSDTVHIR